VKAKRGKTAKGPAIDPEDVARSNGSAGALAAQGEVTNMGNQHNVEHIRRIGPARRNPQIPTRIIAERRAVEKKAYMLLLILSALYQIVRIAHFIISP
jgi:hypothetical protein